MRRLKKVESSMPRGDSRTYPVALPTAIHSAGGALFFAMKTVVDDDPNDTEAVVKKQWTDADIVAAGTKVVKYDLVFAPGDTDMLEPDTYVAEFQWVSADKQTVVTFPDPDRAIWLFTISGDVNRRTA